MPLKARQISQNRDKVLHTARSQRRRRSMAEREIMVDGIAVPYGDQPRWASMATLTGQPATAMPIAMSPNGLPSNIR